MLRSFLSSILLFTGTVLFAQQHDIQVVLHEELINKMLKAVGDISDTANYKVLFYTGSYRWTVINPRIELKASGKAQYKCDVKVEAGFIHYQNEVVGDADVSYDKEKNLINIKILHGIFEIYTRILGAKMHITDIDLAQYYSEPLTFEGPMTLTTSMEFTMPDGTKKLMEAVPVDCQLLVEEHKVIVNCQVEFSCKDPSKK